MIKKGKYLGNFRRKTSLPATNSGDSSPAKDPPTWIAVSRSIHRRWNLQQPKSHTRLPSSTLSLTHWCVAHSLATRFLLKCRRPLTSSSTYLYLMFEPCNSVFQTLLCPVVYLSRVFCLSSSISSRSKGVLWIIGPSSILVFMERWSFFLQDLIFLVFFGFSASCLS